MIQAIESAISEVHFTHDVLRIIAKDAPLSPSDREAVRGAADELETALRAYVKVHAELVDTRSRLVAVSDQLSEARRQVILLVENSKPKEPLFQLNAPVQPSAGYWNLPK